MQTCVIEIKITLSRIPRDLDVIIWVDRR